MQQISPIGGLSLIIHLTINLIIFIYLGILRILKIPGANFISNYFKKLTNKEGDTFTRKALSYSLILVMFILISSNFIFITTNSIGFNPTRIALGEKLDFISKKNIETVSQTPSIEEQVISVNNTNNETPYIIKVTETTSKKLEEVSSVTLVDFMRELGIVDTSFKNRARIALDLGIVDSLENYTGSIKQNREVIFRLKDEVSAHIVNN